MEKEKGSSRRKFLWQMASVAGLTGLTRLVKAMAGDLEPLYVRDEKCVDPELPIYCGPSP